MGTSGSAFGLLIAIIGLVLVVLGMAMQVYSIGAPISEFVFWNLLTLCGIVLILLYKWVVEPPPWMPRILQARALASSPAVDVYRDCPSCGERNIKESRFCHICGESLPPVP